MKKTIQFFAFLGLTLSLFSCKTSQKAIQYQLNLSKSDQFKYSITQESDVNVKVLGTNQKTLNNQTFVLDYQVKEVSPNGDIVLESVIEEVNINQTNAMANMVFDSKNPANNTPDAAMYEAILGTKATAQLNKKGRVMAVSGYDKMIDNMVDKMPSNPMMSKEQIKETIQIQFGDEAMTQFYGNFHKIYPNTPVKVKDSWVKTDTLSGTIEAIIKTTYTLTARKEGKAYIEVNGLISPDKESKGTEMMGMRMQYNLSGTQIGQIVLDEATGWADENEITQNLEGSVKMSGELIPTMDSEMEMISVVRSKKIQ